MADGELLAAQSRLIEAVALARESGARRSLTMGLAALARAERRLGDLCAALTHATEAAQVAREIDVPVCQMWGELEIGLALLDRGDPQAAREHTGRAADLVPRSDESWIGTEQVRQAHARVLRALGCRAEAQAQEQEALALVQEKANRIPDPALRARYLAGRQVQEPDPLNPQPPL